MFNFRSCSLPLLIAIGLATPATSALAAPPPPPGAKKKKKSPPAPPGAKNKKKKKSSPPPPGSKKNKRKRGRKAEEEAAAPVAPPVDTQDTIETRDFGGEKYDVAAIAFYQIVIGEREGDVSRAQFWLAKSLFKQGFFAASLAAFDDIVKSGPKHAYFHPTLPWLASLSRKLPEGAGVLEKIGSYQVEDLEDEAFDEVRDELYYLLGRFNYRKGDLGTSVALLQQVPADSDFYIPSQFYLGVAETREMRAPEAVEAFKNVLRVNVRMREQAKEQGTSGKKELSRRQRKKLGITDADVEFEELNMRYEQTASIALGYIFYQLGRYETAIRYFDRVPLDSPYWLDAVFAASWSEFMLAAIDVDSANRHYQRSLGYVHTVNAPFFYDYLYPESLLLKAVTYYFNCRYGPAKTAIDEFNERYLQTRSDLKQLLKQAPQDYDLYELTVKVRTESSGLDPFVEQVARKSIQDKTLDKHYAFVERLEFEQNLLEQQSEEYRNGAIGEYIDENLELVLSVAKETTGGMARQRLARSIKKIGNLRTDAIKVQYEIINKLKSTPQDQMSAGQKPFVDKEHEIYNYNGEYWQDELGYYNYGVTSNCSE